MLIRKVLLHQLFNLFIRIQSKISQLSNFSTASRKHTMEYLCLLIWAGDKTCCFTKFWNGSPMLTIPTAYIYCVCCLNIVDYYSPSDSQHDRFNSHRHQLLVMLSNKAEQTLLKVLSLLPVLVMDYAILFKLLHSLAVKPEDTTLKYFKICKRYQHVKHVH